MICVIIFKSGACYNYENKFEPFFMIWQLPIRSNGWALLLMDPIAS
jgi:hypothetical protein